jgi:hypothetical protein
VRVERGRLLVEQLDEVPPLDNVTADGSAATFATDAHYFGKIPEGPTRTAYVRNVRRFLA